MGIIEKSYLYRKKQRNYEYFLNKYHHHCYHVFNTYAFCLMNNHFHLLISVRPLEEQEKLFQQQNLKSKKLRHCSKHLSNCFNSYTLSINKQENRTGSLFEKSFKRKEVESEEYFRRMVVYIHQNPVKHGFVNSVIEYPFSSVNHYLNNEPSFINREKTLKIFGGIENFKKAHEEEGIPGDKFTFE